MSPKEWEGVLSALKKEQEKKAGMSEAERDEYENSIIFGDGSVAIAGEIEQAVD